MRIRYQQDDVPLESRNLCIADLIGYKLQRDLDATNKIRKLSGDKTWLSKVVNVARQSKSSTGLTVDLVIEGLKTALNMDIFNFKINNVDPFKILNDELKKKEFVMEVYINPIVFSSEIALKQALMPGFRKKPVTEEFLKERMDRAGVAWAFSFEKGIKDYVDMSKCKKTVLEE